jgi:hypothetical protein
MARNTNIAVVADLMGEFARSTGLDPPGAGPRRYLWTDAFAVCNYLELFRCTGDPRFRDLALRLVGQVHHILGKHRPDDLRSGWISGLTDPEGEQHPTMGGLRIGKNLPERGIQDPWDDRLEWDQDGQYFHYLTKWMHALHQVARVTGDLQFLRWAIELANAAHAAFTYFPRPGSGRMYWKMSIDLSRPLVPSMGQHDPLDGLVTFRELQAAAPEDFRKSGLDLSGSTADMAEICHEVSLYSGDPLGIGGLLFDAGRIAQLMVKQGFPETGLLEKSIHAAERGVEQFTRDRTLGLAAGHRLAFRELGLAIGLEGVPFLSSLFEENPGVFGGTGTLGRTIAALGRYAAVKDTIIRFWTDERNQRAGTWSGHREINMVMLATSLAPGEFLRV